jgi:hypothetical protein
MHCSKKAAPIVDYDPSGDIIANSFQAQLQATGLSVTELVTVIYPRYYSAEEIKIARFPLPKKEKTKLAKWLDKTGGIDGKAYGLESESMPRAKLKELITELIEGVSKQKTSRSKMQKTRY